MDRRKPRVDRDDQTVTAPEEVLSLEFYTDDQIAQWDADDSLEDHERERIIDAMTRRP